MPPPNPFFAFLAAYEHTVYPEILSYLDPLYCCNKDLIAFLKCWKSLGEAEHNDDDDYYDNNDDDGVVSNRYRRTKDRTPLGFYYE